MSDYVVGFNYLIFSKGSDSLAFEINGLTLRQVPPINRGVSNGEVDLPKSCISDLTAVTRQERKEKAAIDPVQITLVNSCQLT